MGVNKELSKVMEVNKVSPVMDHLSNTLVIFTGYKLLEPGEQGWPVLDHLCYFQTQFCSSLSAPGEVCAEYAFVSTTVKFVQNLYLSAPDEIWAEHIFVSTLVKFLQNIYLSEL